MCIPPPWGMTDSKLPLCSWLENFLNFYLNCNVSNPLSKYSTVFLNSESISSWKTWIIVKLKDLYSALCIRDSSYMNHEDICASIWGGISTLLTKWLIYKERDRYRWGMIIVKKNFTWICMLCTFDDRALKISNIGMNNGSCEVHSV